MTHRNAGTKPTSSWLGDAFAEADAVRIMINESDGATERVATTRKSAKVAQRQIKKELRYAWRYNRRALRKWRRSIDSLHWQMEVSSRIKKRVLLIWTIVFRLAGMMWLFARLGFAGYMLWRVSAYVVRFLEKWGVL